jgi:hypothetical protein
MPESRLPFELWARQRHPVRESTRRTSASEEWRDMVDRVDPQDTTFATTNGDYRFLRINNDSIAEMDTVRQIQQWAPELSELR